VANVLNKITMAYLQSVNTPDYPETDWVINPNMSLVEGVPPCYWVLVTQQVEIGTDPETLLPIYGEEYLVREMADEEKAVYDAAHVSIVSTNRLTDGTPAYMYRGFLVSVNTATLTFSVKTTGAKKFMVPFAATGNSYMSDRNRLITNVSMVAGCDNELTLVAYIDGAEAGRWNLSATKRRVSDLEIELKEWQNLSFAVESDVDIVNPVILVDTAHMN